MEQYYNKLYKQKIRKDGNSIGFFLFISTAVSTVVMIVLMLIAMAFNKDFTNQSTTEPADSIISLLLQSICSIIMFFIAGLIYCKITKTSLAGTICFNKTKPSLLFPLIFLGYACTFIAGYLSALFNASISLFGLKTDFEITFNSSDWLSKALYISSVAIIPALVEEFVFRGVILGKLRKYGDTFALFMSALLFGMMHGNLQQIPFAFIGGLAFGFITLKANSLLPAIIVHFMNNFVSVLIDIVNTNKLIPEELLEVLYSGFMFIVLMIGLISVLILSKNKNFFTIKNNNDILTFREKTRSFFISVGMIFFTISIISESITFFKL